MSSLLHELLQHLPEDLDAPFCHFLKDRKTTLLSFRWLLQASWAQAERFRAAGVGQGDIVVIILKHSPEQYSSFLGALLVGAVPSFMPFPNPRQDREHYWKCHAELFQRMGLKALVTFPANQTDMEQQLKGPFPWICFGPEAPAAETAVESILEGFHGGGGGIALLQHSSGTTGLKKGVALSHGPILAQIKQYSEAIGLRRGDVIATWLPLYHDMGLMACFLMPLLRGIPVVALDPFEWVLRPTLLLEAMATHRATLAWLPNFAFHHILGSLRPGDHWDLGSVRAITNCSEPCKADTFSRFAQRFGPMGLGLEQLHTCYALAENVFAATQSDLRQAVKVRWIQPGPLQQQGLARMTNPGEGALPFVSCGLPLPGVGVGIHGPGGEALPEGRVGEVVLSGDSLFSGYFRLPEETRRKCREGRYFTGDLGFLLEGELHITGRQEDLLIVYGQNFYAHDVEFAAQEAGGFIPGRAVALSFHQPELGTEEVVLVAETEGPPPPDGERAIKEAVLARLGLTLRRVLFVPKGWLVKTTSGKISRRENRLKYLEHKESRHEPV